MLSCLLPLSLFSQSEGLLPYAVQCQDSNGQSHPLPRSRFADQQLHSHHPAAPDTYLFPNSVDRLSPSITGRTLNSKAGCQPPKVPDGQGLRTQSRASSQLSVQALPAPSSILDTAVSMRHLRAGQRCRGPTRPSVRPRKRPSP